jgi:DNA-directed RNA polymerase II subunit RPB1
LSKKITLGVPRQKKIINVATNIKTPSLTVYLGPEIAAGASLRAATATVEIWYAPNPTSTIIEEEAVSNLQVSSRFRTRMSG